MNIEPRLLIFALLLIAVVAGFAAGYVRGHKRRWPRFLGTNAYDGSSNYLSVIDELADKKNEQDFEAFVANLAVDSEALETHFALGNLLRKRGETDKAIRIHQNLLVRSNLSREQLQRVQLELSVDYQKSGLLDRAESLLKELSASESNELKSQALESLVALYQGQNDWQRAIDAASQLQSRKLSRRKEHWAMVLCHFCCEIAQEHIEKQNWKLAGDWLSKAKGFQKHNVRLSLLEVQSVLEKTDGHDLVDGKNIGKQLVSLLKSIRPNHPLFQSHVLPLFVACKSRFPSINIEDYLRLLYETEPSEPLMLVLAELIVSAGRREAAAEFIMAETANWPNLKLVAELMSLFEQSQAAAVDVNQLLTLIGDRISEASFFQCAQCGFESATHFWSCPTCKSWETLHPMPRV